MNAFSYEQALAYIHGMNGRGHKDGLRNMEQLLRRLGNPQAQFPSIHITGTNGKGSVCAFLFAALHEAGYRTGLYTSPFLQRYNERMRVDGVSIADDRLAELTTAVAEQVESLRGEGVMPTEFEIGTALAFLYFAAMRVDIAIIEVGLGGRLDSTNVIRPEVTAIASIGLDHTRALGYTEEKIAGEKAGIAKPDTPMILSAQASGPVRETVQRHCAKVGAPLFLAGPEEDALLGLPGEHQKFNAGVAVHVLHALRAKGWSISDEAIRGGLQTARWPGRLEWITPSLLLDGAHNQQGAQALAAYVRALPEQKTVLLCGVLSDKDWQGMVQSFRGIADVVVTVSPSTHRALPASDLAGAFMQTGMQAIAAASLEQAWSISRDLAGKSGRVVAAGSLYLVGELRSMALGVANADLI